MYKNYVSVHMYRKHQTYESLTLAQAANTVVTKEQDKQPKRYASCVYYQYMYVCVAYV